MLRCAKCQSAAVMPKSGLCLACGFIAVVEKGQEDSEATADYSIEQLSNSKVENFGMSEDSTQLIEELEESTRLVSGSGLHDLADSETNKTTTYQENSSDDFGDEKNVLSENSSFTEKTDDSELLTNISEPQNKEGSVTDITIAHRENSSDDFGDEKNVLSEDSSSTEKTDDSELLTNISKPQNREDGKADITIAQLLTSISKPQSRENTETNRTTIHQENSLDDFDNEKIVLSENSSFTEKTDDSALLTNISEPQNREDDSAADITITHEENSSDDLGDEEIDLSESGTFTKEIDNFDWNGSIPPFLQVTHKAKLEKSYVRIIESCQKDLEPLKGALVSKGDGTARSFMVSSTYRKEGVTTSALAVSIALSRFGHSKVLLIDTNAVAPKLHNIFSLTDYPGFIDYINGVDFPLNKKNKVHSIAQEAFDTVQIDDIPWAKYAYYTEYKGLYVMPYALKTESSSLWDVVESTNFNNKLEQLKQAFDYIVFDTSAILGSSEPALLSQYIEGVILVIEAEKTKWEVTELAVNNVRNSGGTFVGAILNKRKFYIPKFLYRWI